MARFNAHGYVITAALSLFGAAASTGCNSDEQLTLGQFGESGSSGAASATQGTDSSTPTGGAPTSSATDGGSASGSASQTNGGATAEPTGGVDTTGAASLTASDPTAATDATATSGMTATTDGTGTSGDSASMSGTSGGMICEAPPGANACTKCAAESCDNGEYCACAADQQCLCLLNCLGETTALGVVSCAITSGCGVAGVDLLDLPASLTKIGNSLEAISACTSVINPQGSCGVVCPGTQYL